MALKAAERLDVLAGGRQQRLDAPTVIYARYAADLLGHAHHRPDHPGGIGLLAGQPSQADLAQTGKGNLLLVRR